MADWRDTLARFMTGSLQDVYQEKYGGRYPGLAENVASGVGTGMKAVGVPKHIAETTGRNITSLAEDWSPFGMLTAAEETGTAAGRGDLAATMLAAAGAIPGVGGKAGKIEKVGRDVLAEAMPTGIRAYHGSPHSFVPEEGAPFGRFKDEAIGTGEGAQAYGQGHYFGENPSVGRDYRESTMAAKGLPQDMRIGGRDITEVYSGMERSAARLPVKAAQGEYDKLALMEDLMHEGDILAVRQRISEGAYTPEVAAWFEREVAPNFNRKGALYEVNISADPEHFLDWDKPLNEQPQKVRDIYSKTIGHQDPTALEERLKTINLEMDAMGMDRDPRTNMMREEGRWHELAREREKLWPAWDAGQSGSKIYNAFVDQTDKARRGSMPYKQRVETATEGLKQAGIPGIKYLDQGSRATSGGELLGVEKTAEGYRAKVRVQNRQGVSIAGGPTDMFTTSKPYASEAEARKWAEGKISEGSRNYVVFDPKIISIVRKFGIAGALGAGLITEEMAGQMQEQGIEGGT